MKHFVFLMISGGLALSAPLYSQKPPAVVPVLDGNQKAESIEQTGYTASSTPMGSESIGDLDSEAAQLPSIKLHPVDGLSGEPLYLSMRDIILATLTQNLAIQIEEKDRDIAGQAVWEQYGIYDPNVSLSVTRSRIDRQTGVVLPGASNQVASYSDTTSAEASISQRTPIGTIIEVFADDTRTYDKALFNANGLNTLNPTYGSNVGARVTQPLLKNSGALVNNAQIRISKIRLGQSNEQFKAEIMAQLSDIMRAYWDLDFAIRFADVQRQALESARELERVNGVRVDVGTLPRLSLFQAQAQVAERESLLAEAEASIISSQDRLLTLMNWTPENRFEQWDRPIFPVDSPTTFYDVNLLDDVLVDLALEKRPDYQAAKLGLDIAEINRDVTKRQMLPELNAFGEYSWSGLEDQRSDSYDTTRTGDYANYSFGAEFNYPLFNRTARSQYRQAQDSMTQQELVIESQELAIVQQVRSATRSNRTALRQIQATTRQVKADIEKLDAEIKRQQVGERTTFDVLDFQDDLALSRANQARAFADYQQSLVDLAESMGILLEVQGIVVDDLNAPKGWAYGYTSDDTESPSINTNELMTWDEMLTIIPRKKAE